MSVCCIRWGRGICCRISELSDFQVDESWHLNSSILKLGDSTLKVRLDAPTALPRGARLGPAPGSRRPSLRSGFRLRAPYLACSEQRSEARLSNGLARPRTSHSNNISFRSKEVTGNSQ